MSGGPQPFVILGHGTENVETAFNDRAKLPAGYTLVTMSVCGAYTKLGDIQSFLNSFNDPANKDLFSNPGLHANKMRIQEICRQKIHIYKEGSFYPDLTVSSLLDWKYHPLEKKRGFFALKSGLYSFPLNNDLFADPFIHFELSPEDDVNYKRILYKVLPETLKDKLTSVYNGSIFPTSSTVQENIESIVKDWPPPERLLKGESPTKKVFSLHEFEKRVTFPLSEILKASDPGVYFYVVCRYPKGFNHKEIMNEFEDLTNEEKVPFDNPRETNYIQYLPLLYPAATRVSEYLKKQYGNVKSDLRTQSMIQRPTSLKNTYNKVMLLRSASYNQQAKLDAEFAASEAAAAPEAASEAAAAPEAASEAGAPEKEHNAKVGGSRRRRRVTKKARRRQKSKRKTNKRT